MISFLYGLAFFMVGVMISLMALGLAASILSLGFDQWSRRFFITMFSVLLLCSITVLIDCLVYGNPAMFLVEQITSYLESVSASIPILLFTVYLIHSTGEDVQRSRIAGCAAVLWIVFFILSCIACSSPLFYYFSDRCEFFIGPLFPLLFSPLILIMFMNLIITVRRRSRIKERYYHAFLFCFLLLTAAIIIHAFFYSSFLIIIGYTISAFSMFIIILYSQIEQNMLQQKEIAQQRASIMVLQMRPHFIYNTMMSIYYLCVQDSRKAQEVILSFTDYLRRNFTAIASEEPIPFSEELEHTRAYLAVEQAQFEDMLFVEYDIAEILFKVPPLTLQPIVENAVKHGMDPDGEPLHISIRTRRTDEGNEIIVEDNGSGFEPSDDSEPHIALGNIRQRLELMCHGTMTITARNGGGAVVTITVPFRPQTDD